MLERFKEGVEVNHKNTATEEDKNKNRQEAIEDSVSNDISISKDRFLDHIRKKGSEKYTDIAQKVEQIDFSNAHPRNNTFMNELAFAGASMTEGFLEVFNIEKDTAVQKYQDQIQIIETKKDNQPSQYSVGTFQKGKLKKLSPDFDNRKELEKKLDASLERQRKEQEEKMNRKKDQQQEITQTISLERQKEN
ncbi:hypothetical protein B795N_14840 [Marinilactibacillus psychrotolerans]|nr:hypothetical protein B795N_14840 [Marinilactibacillus psychrotolerans]